MLCNQLLAARNEQHARLTKALVLTVHEIEHRYVVSSGIVADELYDKHPRGWIKLVVITIEEAMEEYIVVVMAKSHLVLATGPNFRVGSGFGST
jgi:hypothetical protein